MHKDESDEAAEAYWAGQRAALRARLEELVSDARGPLARAIEEVSRLWDPERNKANVAGVRTGIGQGAMSSYKNGKRMPGGENLLLIHLITGWPLDRILGLRTRPDPQQIVEMVSRMTPDQLGPLLSYLRDQGVISGHETVSELRARTSPPPVARDDSPIALLSSPPEDRSHVAPPKATNLKRARRKRRH